MCYKIRKAKGRVPLVDLRRDIDFAGTPAELFKRAFPRMPAREELRLRQP
jgi:hypothetical protein